MLDVCPRHDGFCLSVLVLMSAFSFFSRFFGHRTCWGIKVIIGSIPIGADPMVEWFLYFLRKRRILI